MSMPAGICVPSEATTFPLTVIPRAGVALGNEVEGVLAPLVEGVLNPPVVGVEVLVDVLPVVAPPRPCAANCVIAGVRTKRIAKIREKYIARPSACTIILRASQELTLAGTSPDIR